MNVLVIYAHPEPKSFNAAMKDVAVSTLTAQGHTVRVSDLYAQGFNPVAGRGDFIGAHDPEQFSYLAEQAHAVQHGTLAPDIVAEQENLRWADLVLFQYPVWWRSPPAILKGWFERVLSLGFAYTFERTYASGGLAGKRAMVAVTTGGPMGEEDARNLLFHLHDGVLAYVGFEVLPPFVAGGPALATAEQRAGMLAAWRERLLSLGQASVMRAAS